MITVSILKNKKAFFSLGLINYNNFFPRVKAKEKIESKKLKNENNERIILIYDMQFYCDTMVFS